MIISTNLGVVFVWVVLHISYGLRALYYYYYPPLRSRSLFKRLFFSRRWFRFKGSRDMSGSILRSQSRSRPRSRLKPGLSSVWSPSIAVGPRPSVSVYRSFFNLSPSPLYIYTFFYKSRFYKNMRLKIFSKFKNNLRTCSG
jgi:hypothetical protein